MPRCRKRGHIGAELGENNLRRNPAYTGDRGELFDGIAERRQQVFDPRIEGCDVLLQFFDQPEMMSNRKPMIVH